MFYQEKNFDSCMCRIFCTVESFMKKKFYKVCNLYKKTDLFAENVPDWKSVFALLYIYSNKS